MCRREVAPAPQVSLRCLPHTACAKRHLICSSTTRCPRATISRQPAHVILSWLALLVSWNCRIYVRPSMPRPTPCWTLYTVEPLPDGRAGGPATFSCGFTNAAHCITVRSTSPELPARGSSEVATPPWLHRPPPRQGGVPFLPPPSSAGVGGNVLSVPGPMASFPTRAGPLSRTSRSLPPSRPT